jgi:hypothetical protein
MLFSCLELFKSCLNNTNLIVSFSCLVVSPLYRGNNQLNNIGCLKQERSS